MVPQCIFVLVLLIWCGHTCDNSILIANVAVIGVTGGDDWADSDTGHNACINNQCHKLPDLQGDDKMKWKGDWYNMANWNGMKICDVYDFRFKQGGNDGWQIAKVTVLIRGNNGRVYVPVFRNSFNQWIDGDWVSSVLQTDNLIQSGWRNDLPSISETVNVQNVYLIAETGHVSNAESDTGHKLRIQFAGVSIEAPIPDLPGDDYQKHKTDWWTFGTQFDIINVNDIHDISLKANGDDGWVVHDVAVIIQTSNGWYVPVMEENMPAKFLQDDGNASEMEIYLTMLTNWRGMPFIGFEETIGYWKVLQTGNGNEDSWGVSEWKGFSEAIASESEQMQAFSLEISEEVGVSVTVGGEFGALSAEQQYSYTLGYTMGTEQANTIRNAVENSIDGGSSVECTFMNPAPGELFTFWVWTTYRKSNIENTGATLQTCNGHFKTGPKRNIAPNCVPGGCLDNECMDCISSDWVIDASATSDVCPAGWTNPPVGGRCFMYSSSTQTYDDSVAYCETIGGVIASIHSNAENAAVYDLMPSGTVRAYLGAESNGNGVWSWHDGTAWWEPSNTDGLAGVKETRIVMTKKNNGQWHDWKNGEVLNAVICATPTISSVPQDSCYDSCDGQSKSGDCWCDYLCTEYQDCCSDYHSQCSRRALGEVENTEKNGQRNLAETKKKQGSTQRLLKML